jgi:predicted aspartyl protease
VITFFGSKIVYYISISKFFGVLKMLRNLTFIAMFLLIFLKASLVSAVDFGTSVPINKKGLVTYYVSGSIQGYGATDFLVDTGSGHSAINEETLEKLLQQGNAKFFKTVSATLANGADILLPVYKISDINIGGECVINNVEAVVLPGKVRNILGLSALEKTAPFAISVNPPRLLLSHCSKVST